MNNLKEQAHKEFDEKLPQMITDLIWAITDGGQKIEPKRFLSFQEEPVYEFEQIKSFIDSLIDKTVQMTEERIVGIMLNQEQNFKQLWKEYKGTKTKGEFYSYLVTNKK